MTVEASTTLADLVIEDGRRARILEELGLDYCCHGHRSLADAAAEAAIDLQQVREALSLPGKPAPEKPSSRARSELAHDIVDTHHAYMWQEMPRLQALVEKVHQAHGDRHPELRRVHRLFGDAVAALDPHMTKEERAVFPAISRMERNGSPVGSEPLAAQIDELVQEHAVVGDLFKEINSATDGYAEPADACPSYQLMLRGLQEMELDLHEHIHKENNVLFPQAIELERNLTGGE